MVNQSIGVFVRAVALVAFSAAGAFAQTIDTLKIMVPAAPGGGWDQTGRAIEMIVKAEGLAKNVQITHVPGAGGTIGLPQFVNQWKGQPASLMVGGMVMVGAIAANKSAAKLTDVQPLARLTGEFEVIVVPANSPHQSMADLVKALKADPGKVAWAGGSAGGTDHILVGLIAEAVGVDPTKINYVAYSGGGPAQAAILGGHVAAGVSGWGEFAGQIEAGKMRALAISSPARVAGIAAPTLKEQGVAVELLNWRGVFAPPGLKEPELKALAAAIEKMANSAAWKVELEKKQWLGTYMPAAEFTAYVAAETKAIEAILAKLGIAK
ncbi:MAG: tripartite tricarboxylate transporter substrate binding protein [Alphaproteobacteria bacterium]|nr:tripartite tricarboxylate transporter substrate binding protein [Alphaproteobacteria bacterium]